jgi:hypothetical protein
MLGTIYLGHYLAEKQQEKGKQYGEKQELEPFRTWAEVHPVHKKDIEQHDNAHVHQVVHYQDGCQHAVTLFAQLQYMGVATALLFRDFGKMLRGETEKRYLAGRGKAAAYKQQHAASETYPCKHGRFAEGYRYFWEYIGKRKHLMKCYTL